MNKASPVTAPLKSIQMLRGLAALAVCMAHLHAVESKFGSAPILGNWALSGFAGVDLFFVISGFVMVWVTNQDQGKASAIPGFWFSRVARIYPLWWLVLSALVAVWLVKPGWVYSSHVHNPDLVASYLLLPGKELPLHAVGWTLIHEVWFYLVFGLLLMVPQRYLPFALAIWGLGTVSAALAFPSPVDPILALVRHPLTIEFIMGAGVGLIARQKWFFASNIVSQVAAFWIVLSAVTIHTNPPEIFAAEWPRVFMFGLPCALLVWGQVGIEQLQGHRAPGWSLSLGNWSYALYLIHVPVFAALGRLAAPLSRPGSMDNVLLLSIAFPAAIIAAWLLHVGFEKPVAALTNRLRPLFGAKAQKG